MNLFMSIVDSFQRSEEDTGILRAAGGDVKGLGRMYVRLALAVFLLLLVAPPLLVFVNRSLAGPSFVFRLHWSSPFGQAPFGNASRHMDGSKRKLSDPASVSSNLASFTSRQRVPGT